MKENQKEKGKTQDYTQVYVMGNSELLGFKSKEQFLCKPKLCSYNILIKQVACG